MVLNKTAANPIRTSLQIGLAAIVISFIHNFFYEMNMDQQASATAILVVIISFAQNLIEQKTGKVLLLPNVKQQQEDQAEG